MVTPSLEERLENEQCECAAGPTCVPCLAADELRRLEGELETERATWCKEAQTCTHEYIDEFGHCDGCMVNLSELVALRAENARLREALHTIGDPVMGDADVGDDGHYCDACGQEADLCDAISDRPTRCDGAIARAALAPAPGGEEDKNR